MNRRNWLKISSLIASGSFLNQSYAHNQVGCTLPDFPSEYLRMGSNENPYGPSPMALAAMQNALQMGNRYPDTYPLKEKIAAKFGLTPQHILLGAGSAEILGLIALAYFSKGQGSLVAPKPTFFVLLNTAERLGARLINVPLTTDKKHDLEAMAKAIESDTKLIYICNPNNPTGTKLPPDQLRAFVEEISKKYVVAIDEVYHDFINEPSMIPLVANNKNVIVARSFSKVYGLAGMRVGFGVAHPETLAYLSKFVAWPGNAISQVTNAAAMASLDDVEFVRMSLQKNEESKQMLYQFLKSKGINYTPSFTNCSYFELDSKLPTNFVKRMEEEKKVVVREYNDYGKLYCRVSTGKPEDMQQFIAAATALIG